MNIVGFDFTKVLAQSNRNPKATNINNVIGFDSVEKEDIKVLNDLSAIRATFFYRLEYSESEKKQKDSTEDPLIEFKGNIIITATKEEEKEILKLAKKKEYQNPLLIPIFNFIMHKCSIKAFQLEDEMNLRPHIPLPRLSPQQMK